MAPFAPPVSVAMMPTSVLRTPARPAGTRRQSKLPACVVLLKRSSESVVHSVLLYALRTAQKVLLSANGRLRDAALSHHLHWSNGHLSVPLQFVKKKAASSGLMARQYRKWYRSVTALNSDERARVIGAGNRLRVSRGALAAEWHRVAVATLVTHVRQLRRLVQPSPGAGSTSPLPRTPACGCGCT